MTLSKKVRSRWTSAALPALNRFARRAQRATKLRGRVDVLLVSSTEIRAMNRDFRRKNKMTDVLSFPASHDDSCGDIAICAARAHAQAREFGHAPREEAKILILHGMLHLAGYDHERDRGQMARREVKLRKELGLPSGLIERMKKGRRK